MDIEPIKAELDRIAGCLTVVTLVLLSLLSVSFFVNYFLL